MEIFDVEVGLDRFKTEYLKSLNMLHSNSNYDGERISIEFDELDVNKTDISSDNPLFVFNNNDFGLVQTNFADNVTAINNNTRYIRFTSKLSNLGDFATIDFDDNDFFTTANIGIILKGPVQVNIINNRFHADTYSRGTIYDARGIDLDTLKDIKLKRRESLEKYLDSHICLKSNLFETTTKDY